MSYITKFSQNIVLSTVNSTVGNLTAGSWFAGVAENNLGVGGIQFTFKSDQNCTVYIDQGDGIQQGFGTSVTTSGTGLTGIGTKFLRDFVVGDQIFVGAQTVRVVTVVNSDTSLTVGVAFDTDASGLSYTQYSWDASYEYNFLANAVIGITRSAAAQGSNVRMRVHNPSASATTFLRLTTCLIPIKEPMPDSVNPDGHLKTHIYGLSDGYNFDAEFTPQGDIRAVSPVKLVGVSFDGSTIDTNFWSVVNQNGGTITQRSGRIDMLTNTTANGSATFYSVRKGRYITGYANVLRIQGRVGDTGTANNIRQWGCGIIGNYTLTVTSATVVAGDEYTDASGVQYTVLMSTTGTTITVYATATPTAGARTYTRVSGTGDATLTGSAFTVASILTDGYFFQLSGTTFSIVTMLAGTPTPIDSGAFNGDLGPTFQVSTNVNTYEIYYDTKNVWFAIEGKILHTATGPLTPLSNTYNFHVIYKNTNSAGSTTNAGLYTRAGSIKRLGLLDTEQIFKYTAAATTITYKYGAGKLHRIIFGDPDLAQIVTVYDGLTANAPIIARLTNITATNAHGRAHTVVEFGCPFNNGLTITTSTAVPVTIIYE